MEERRLRKWTDAEDAVALRYIKANPQNLKRCFMMISEHLTESGFPRTIGGVQSHWYTVLSKRPEQEALCFFTASTHSVSKNRKNGMGVSTRPSIWRRFLNIINSIC